MDILGGGFVGRPTQKIGKLFDVADVLVLSLGTEPPDRHVLDQPPAYGTDGLLGHWGLLSWVRFKAPQSQDRTPVFRYSRNPSSCHQLPRERFSPPARLDRCGASRRRSLNRTDSGRSATAAGIGLHVVLANLAQP